MKGDRVDNIKHLLQTQKPTDLPGDLEDLVMLQIQSSVKKKAQVLTLKNITVYSILASTYVLSIVFLTNYFGNSVWLKDIQLMLQIGLIIVVLYHLQNVITEIIMTRTKKILRS
ncbi:MAG: hypothetical protein COA58_06220 [Bacteroidetes bacterium]|nr:MAG: hypothetical protein COA58_06220 [Bacteroidota bacterium]